MTKVEERFCEELQELLDRYKTQLGVPVIMRNAQKVFHDTLSIRTHPELHKIPLTHLEALKEFIKGDGVGYKWTCVDEFHDMMEQKDAKRTN